MSMQVVLADPYALVRVSLQALLTAQPEVDVVAAIGDGAEAVRHARTTPRTWC